MKAGRWRGVLAAVILLVSLVLVAGVAGWIGWNRLRTWRAPYLEPAAIRAAIVQESPVYYRDKLTRIGVLFDEEHRTWIGYDEIPEAWVSAIVASEDQRFWFHPGIDVFGVSRAMLRNLQAGHVVAGGSTITQQTAKTLFRRPDRSIRAKLEEARNAIALDAQYPKPMILEFYANHFHVTGNGRGLAVGARYFFDKDPTRASVDPSQRLSLIECAFLAGMVKGPASYDPFRGDEAARQKALTRAHDRVIYVLKRLVDSDPAAIAYRPNQPSPGPVEPTPEALANVKALQQEAAQLLAGGFEIPFRRGTFQFSSNVLVDRVQSLLNSTPYRSALEGFDIDDPTTAGLKLVTTLDETAQRAASWGLVHHLTEVGLMLEASVPEDLILTDVSKPAYAPDLPLVPRTFRLASVTGPAQVDGKDGLAFDVGGLACFAGVPEIERVANALKRGRDKNTWAKASRKDVEAVIGALVPGSVVRLGVDRLDEASGQWRCQIEWRPVLQGAAVVLQGGRLLAMVGGQDNRDFNRADAPRQLGSTWKTLVYHAAIGLGWLPTDALDNRIAPIRFSTTTYVPKPDHKSVPVVSLGWAGVKSENVATIWLLTHLFDKTSLQRRIEIADELGFLRGEGEDKSAYRTRMAALGVKWGDRSLLEARVLGARDEVLAALHGTRHPEDALELSSLRFDDGGLESQRGSIAPEARWAIDHNWVSASALLEACEQRFDALDASLELGSAPSGAGSPALWFALEGDAIAVACGEKPEGYGTFDAQWISAIRTPAFAGEDPDEPEVGEGGFEGPSPTPRLEPREDRWIGRFHHSTLDALRAVVARREIEASLSPELDPSEPEVLLQLQDMRVMMAMRWLATRVHVLGIPASRTIQEVLSMPLGASEISITEAATMYSAMLTGRSYQPDGLTIPHTTPQAVDLSDNSALMLAQIIDSENRSVLDSDVGFEEIDTPEHVAMLRDILRHVVTHGTGRSGFGQVRWGSVDYPIVGKTGTTNDYKNTAFLGAVPMADHADSTDPLVIAVYVGYDDNRPMTRRALRFAGATGAMPAWLSIAQGLVEGGLAGKPAATAGSVQWPVPEGLMQVPVRIEDGLPDTDTSSGVTLLVPGAVAEEAP